MENQAVQKVQTADQLGAIEAAQIDQQIVTAHKFPRNEDGAVVKSMKMATRNAIIAQKCIYFRPVGKKDGIQQFSEGSSIRLAEIMKIQWGNLRIKKRVIGTRDGMIGVEWGVHDLESNVMESGEVWKSYFGSEKMIPVITSAAMKFAERDAVFTIVPKSYADEVVEECKATIVGDDENKDNLLAALVSSFAEMGVDQDKLFSVIDRKEYPQGSDSEVVFILGLHNAIKDGLCSVDDAFGKESSSSKPKVSETKVKETNQKKADTKKQSAKKEDPKPEEKKQAPIDFKQLVRDAGKSAGCENDEALNNALQAIFQIEDVEDITEDQASKIVDYFVEGTNQK